MKYEPYQDCPRFMKCAVANCPLTFNYPNWDTSPHDAEKNCTLAKSIRMRISAQHPRALKFGGLKTREYGSRQAWESKSSEEQAKIRVAAKKMGLSTSAQKSKK